MIANRSKQMIPLFKKFYTLKVRVSEIELCLRTHMASKTKKQNKKQQKAAEQLGALGWMCVIVIMDKLLNYKYMYLNPSKYVHMWVRISSHGHICSIKKLCRRNWG